MPCARVAQLGLHGARARARLSLDRQVRPARAARAYFPMAPPFRMPDDDPLPAPIDVDPQARDQVLVLAVPLRAAGVSDVDRAPGANGLVRHAIRELEARDTTSRAGDVVLLEVGAMRTRLMLASEVTQGVPCVPLAHIVECRADKQVVLDESFIPTVLDAHASVSPAHVHDRASRTDAPAGRGARRPRGGHRPRVVRRDCRLPDAAGAQPA